MISKAFSSPAAWLAPMLPLWNQQMMLGGEASLVIARRLSLMALADPRAAAESQLMVTEKLEAAAQVWWDLALAPSRAWWAGLGKRRSPSSRPCCIWTRAPPSG